jgi:diguanylate cyclase (GGDEF)-like protein/PAS domain S-box-containing protein
MMDLSLQESELRYRRLFESAQDGILILNADTGAITDVNPFMMRMLGYARDDFIHKKIWEVGAFKDIEASQIAFEALQKDKYIRYQDLPLRAKDGKLVQVEFVSNVYMEGGEKVIQCNIRDITERKQAQDALVQSEAHWHEQSVRDHLTGLFNRRYLEETLERELMRASRRKHPLGVIMMDVDGFKKINDSFGHGAGDAILRSLGGLLQEHIRGYDIPSRFGGDEFIVVLPDASRVVTRERAELVRAQAHLLRVQWEGQTLAGISLSLGISVYPEDGTTNGALLKAVDMALYCAKQEGRDRVRSAPQASTSSTASNI